LQEEEEEKEEEEETIFKKNLNPLIYF